MERMCGMVASAILAVPKTRLLSQWFYDNIG